MDSHWLITTFGRGEKPPELSFRTQWNTLISSFEKVTRKHFLISHRFLIVQRHLNPKLPDRDEGLEITAVAQLGEDNCVVGVGGGGILHCALSPLQPPSRRPGYKDPVITVYQQHQAVVTAIRAGPGGKTFASVSSDGQIRVYKTLEVTKTHNINWEEMLWNRGFQT